MARKSLVFFIIGQISLFFIFAGIRYFLEEIVVYSIGGYHNYHESRRVFWYYVFDNSYYSLQIILFSTFIYLLLQYQKNNNKIHELQLEHQKAEMGALKMQLEPHFLFNTLNVFYTELIETQPETAKGIHKLSDLLRHLTYDAQKDYIPLKKELQFINDYIFFYKKRFENNLYLNFNVKGDVDDQEIPSLILIHFVENIFKHGITNDKNNPVKITIEVANNTLILETQNKVSSVKNYSSNGIGRKNLQKRLHLIYKDKYDFTHKQADNFYISYLKIPLK
ncbi:MAG: histidine kinase [Flavobacteriaceae bacterium]